SAAHRSKFWAGPLTLVVPTRSSVRANVTDNSQLVGLRIPNHDATRRLIEESGGAIVWTSANISGHRSLSTAQEVLRELGGRIDLVLDGGHTMLGRESTVVRIVGDEIVLLREAAISWDDILKALPATRAS